MIEFNKANFYFSIIPLSSMMTTLSSVKKFKKSLYTMNIMMLFFIGK